MGRLEMSAGRFDDPNLDALATGLQQFGQKLENQGLPENLGSVSVWQKDPISGRTFYEHDQFSFFPDSHTVEKNGREIRLSSAQNRLLQALVEKPNMAQSMHDLKQRSLESDYYHEGYLRRCVSELRKKIEPNPKKPQIIINIRAYGYYLNDEKRLSDGEIVKLPLIERLMPQTKLAQEVVISYHGLTYFPQRSSVLLNGKELSLTRRQNQLLQLLASHHSEVVTYRDLEGLWETDAKESVDVRDNIKQAILKLGKTIGQTSIVSVRGIGYRLVGPDNNPLET